MKQRSMCFFISFLLLFAFVTSAKADYQTSLVFNGYIQSGSAAIDAGLWSAPTVYDWNSDGAKDLLVGRKGTDGIGYVSFYQNYGSDNSPSFNGYTDIQTCSVPVCTNGGG